MARCAKDDQCLVTLGNRASRPIDDMRARPPDPHWFAGGHSRSDEGYRTGLLVVTPRRTRCLASDSRERDRPLDGKDGGDGAKGGDGHDAATGCGGQNDRLHAWQDFGIGGNCAAYRPVQVGVCPPR